MRAGHDYVGIGVGAIVTRDDGRVFLARRGFGARNEAGTWEFPGGAVKFGERLEDAVRREFVEEYGMEIGIVGLLGVFDHILPAEGQHWVSATYLATRLRGEPTIREPGKCSEIGWFHITSLPSPRSLVTMENLREYLTKTSPNSEGAGS